MTDVSINDMLTSLGLTGREAERARAVLEREGITNPRKVRLSVLKIERARAAIDCVFARLCHDCEARVLIDGRQLVRVRPDVCARCGGSRNDRALDELRQACDAAMVRQLVVVGGSPNTRRELAALTGKLELRLVDGTERRTRTQADHDLAWADLVVVCGGTQLAHDVSLLYTRPKASTPVITATRRGVEAIVSAVVQHLGSRR